MKTTALLRLIKPYVLGWISAAIGVGVTGSYAPIPHDIDGACHEGVVSDAQGPQFLKTDGSRALTGNMAVDTGVTIDGVDISAHRYASAVDGHQGIGSHNHYTPTDGGQLDHGNAMLANSLLDDDHPCYAPVDGSRPFGEGPGYGKHFSGEVDPPAWLLVHPEGDDDVKSVLTVMYAVVESGGGTASGVTTVYPDASNVTLYTDGTNTLVIHVSVAGAISVSRTAGTSTFEVSLWLTWI